MTCIKCGGDHEVTECPDVADTWSDDDAVTSITDGVDRYVDEDHGHAVYVAYAEDGTVTAIDAVDLPSRDPTGIGAMIERLEDMKAGRPADEVMLIDDRIAALRSLKTDLAGGGK